MRIAREVLAIELLQLVRDKRALFSAVVLPALLYPLFFWGTAKLETVGRETMAKRDLTVLADMDSAPAAARDAFLRELEALGPVTVTPVLASPALESAEGREAERQAAIQLLAQGGAPGASLDAPQNGGPGAAPVAADSPADLLLIARSDDGAPGLERTTFELWHDIKSDDAREALSRARQALRSVERAEVDERRLRLLGGDPARALDPDVRDVATEEDASGAALGKWLPFIALLVLISGGAYAALAVFAGEREAGTLETLLVQPVPSTSVAWGKFAAVFIAGFSTLLVNLASLVLCVTLGLADMDALGGASGGLGITRLAALLIEIPACLLLCAILCLVCGGARTFREGQLLVFPVTLAVVVPTSIVLRPDVDLTAFWALIPFAGSALALREGLAGGLSLPLGALVVGSHLGWTWLALLRVGKILDAEKVLGGGGDAKAEGHLRQAGGRHAVRFGFATVMLVYLVAGAVQRYDLKIGLGFTFWLLLPLLALAVARTVPTGHVDPGSLRERLGLRLPHPAHLLGAVLLVPALVRGAMALSVWQRDVLPLPPGAEQAMEAAGGVFDMSPTWLFIFLALSPGIFEELLFRGALLESMKRDWRVPRMVAWQALYFALVHSSIYRLLPTGILGALLTLVALRSRSVIPAMVLHVAYNSAIVLGEGGTWEFVKSDAYAYAPWAAIPGLLLLLLVRGKSEAAALRPTP